MPSPINLSGERFSVIYRLTGDETLARAKAADICLEQTAELADDLVPAGLVRDHIVGRIESFEPVGERRFRASISYAVETVGHDLLQLLNVIYGNVSIKPGIRVEQIRFPEGWVRTFKGPRLGRDGVRERLGVPRRPLLCAPLKPMGFSCQELGDLAYQFARGGIDIVKDDHGLANQSSAPFRERVTRCVQAVEQANRETGFNCIYMPNVTGPHDEIVDRALFAKRQGAGGLLVSPGLTGFDTMRCLADDDRIGLPIMSHPSFQGSFVTSPNDGISHGVLFGQLARLAGADATIFPNFGGRFSFSREECAELAWCTSAPLGHVKPIFPTPGGGMSLARVPDMLETYGRQVILLIGGDMYRHGPDLAASCRLFRRLVEAAGD